MFRGTVFVEHAAAVVSCLLAVGCGEPDPRASGSTADSLVTLPNGDQVVMRRLWALPVGSGFRLGSVTPDGRRMAVGAVGDDQHIRLLDLERRAISVIVEEDAGDTPTATRFTMAPLSSPSGDQLAFWEVYEGGPRRLRVMRMDGSGGRTLYDGSMGPLWPLGWSPDGSRLVGWLWERDRSRLAIVGVSTTETSIIKFLGWRETLNARFSPDGRFIAYSTQPDSASAPDIFLLSRDGSEEAVVAAHRAEDAFLDWTPLGDVVFRSDRLGSSDLWAVAVEDGEQAGDPVLVARDISPAQSAGFTAAGDFVFDIRHEERSYDGTLDTDPRLRVTSATASDTGRAPQSPAQYSPDGEYVAIPVSNSLVIREVGTGDERTIPAPSGRWIAMESWTPDGAALVVQAYSSNGDPHIALIDRETGSSTDLIRFQGSQTAYSPRLGADNRTLYFARVPPDAGETRPGSIVAVDAETGDERTVFTAPSDRPYIWQIAVHPDGSRIAFALGRSPLMDAADAIAIIDLGGSLARTIVVDDDEHFYDVRWMAGGQSVAFLRSVDDGRRELWRLDAATGRTDRIDFTDGLPPIGALGSFHPDGERFTYLSLGASEIWTILGLGPAVRRALAGRDPARQAERGEIQ